MFSGNVAFTLLRYILTLASGVMVSRGYVTGGVAETVVGVIVAAGSAGYGSYTSTRDAQLARVASMPDVDAVVKTNGDAVKSIGGELVIASSPREPNSAMNDR